MATVHTPEELQEMFAAFGLAGEEDRQRFRDMTREFGEPSTEDGPVFAQRLSGTTGPEFPSGANNAELEQDS
jgi:hypothetical protein